MKKSSNKNQNDNYKRVKNIETLMNKEGYNLSKDFAHDIDMYPQNFSRAMQSGKITEKMCYKIIERFPEYRVEWLLGYDNIMTHHEWADDIQRKKDILADSLWGIIENSLHKKGKSLKFVHRSGQHVNSSERLHSDCYYSVVDNETGKETKRLNAIEMIRFEIMIQDYCDFLSEKYL